MSYNWPGNLSLPGIQRCPLVQFLPVGHRYSHVMKPWRAYSSKTEWILMYIQRIRTEKHWQKGWGQHDSLCSAVFERSVIPMLFYLVFSSPQGWMWKTMTSLFINSSFMNTCSHHWPFITNLASNCISCSGISLTLKGSSLLSCFFLL